tara:strand:+ start:1302 stop:1649 length:348 start_codon:yes stop_codon:yes gene_type:complete
MSKVFNALMNDPGPAIYYSEGLRRVMEDHMTFLRTSNKTRVITPTDNQLHRFEYDLNGLLIEMGIPRHLLWVHMRVNDFTSPVEVTQDNTELLSPSPEDIERIVNLYRTVNTIKT